MQNVTAANTSAPLRMVTIRQAAATGILPEHCIRTMVKTGEIPCVYAGTKALLNLDKLIERLQAL